MALVSEFRICLSSVRCINEGMFFELQSSKDCEFQL